jgi:putative transcriptional regulator
MRNEIKVFRARFEMTQEQLAERVGVTRQTIIAIEKDKYPNMSLLLAFRIARVFGVNVEEVFIYNAD